MKIDWKNAYMGILRGLATGARLAGLEERAKAIEKVIAGIESGHNVDKHMEGIAIAVASDDPNDWADVTRRINEHGDEFQRPAQ